MSQVQHKWQLLHDYLLSTQLVTAEQLRVHGVTDVVTPGSEDYHGKIGFASRYICALHITDFGADTTRLKLELARWISHYQPEQIDTEAFDIRIDPINRDTVNLFIELELTEKGSFDRETGEHHLCAQMIEPLLILPPNDAIDITTQEHINHVPVTE